MKTFFDKILPDYDKERVYVSDIKKVVVWYNILVENDLVDLKEDEKESEKDQSEEKEEAEGSKKEE